MNIHQNARLTPKGRALLVRRIRDGQTVQAAAAACGVSTRTAYRWLRRYRHEGQAGLWDRSSESSSQPASHAPVRRRPCHRFCAVSAGPAAASPPISASRLPPSAASCVVPVSSGLLTWNPPRPCSVDEHPRPGICCISTSKSSAVLIRPVIVSPPTGPNAVAAPAGSSFTSPLTTTLAWRSRRSCPMSAAARRWRFYGPAVAYYRLLGVRIRRLLTDNGSCYRSHAFR